MKTFLLPFFLLLACSLFGQQEPVKLCAQVDKNGVDIDVNIFVSDFVNIASYQFGVAWETDKYEFVSIENINDSAPAAYSQVFDNIPDQISLLRTLWFDETAITPQTLDDETLLYTVKLTQTNANLEGLIGIAPTEDFMIEFSNGNIELVDAALDLDGCSILSFVSLTNNEDVIIDALSVSPNPFVDQVQVKLDEANTGIFKVYSVTGSLINTYNYTNEKVITLSLDNYQAGTYILSHESNDGKVLGQSKIVKL